MQLPPKKRPGNPILASDWNTLLDALAARTPRPSATLEIVSSSGGFSYRARQMGAPSSCAVLSGCPFGQIVTWVESETTKTGIRGGVVYAGDKVWNVPNKELNLDADGSFIVWLEVGVTANVIDDVLLPGLETSEEPTWKQAAEDADYPDLVIPEADSPGGTAIVALGKLTIADGVATFEPTACGDVVIDGCPGTLSLSRSGSIGGGTSGGSGGGSSGGAVGPTGPAGPAGPAGPSGPTGPAGPAGPTGPAGPAGTAGTVGSGTTTTLPPGYIYVNANGTFGTTPPTAVAVGTRHAQLSANWHADNANVTAPGTNMDITGTALTLPPGNWHITGNIIAISDEYNGARAWLGIRFSGGAAVTNGASQYVKWVPYAYGFQAEEVITVSIANNTTLSTPIYCNPYQAYLAGGTRYLIFEVDMLVHVAVSTSVRLLAGKMNGDDYWVQGTAGQTWLTAEPV